MRGVLARQSNAAFKNTAHVGLGLASGAGTYWLRCKSTQAGSQSHRRTLSWTHRNNESSYNMNVRDKSLSYIKASTVNGIVLDLNSTRPPPLDLPTPPHPLAWPKRGNLNPSNWDFKYLFALGKAHGKFFWSGIKKVWANLKTRSAIKKRIQNERYPDIYTSLANSSVDVGTAPTTQGGVSSNTSTGPIVTYNEWEFLDRVRNDAFKFLPFGLVVLVFGEFTPFAILVLGSRVVPGTCVIPKQVASDLRSTLEREDKFLNKAAEFIKARSDSLPWKTTNENGQTDSADVAAAEEQRQKWLLLQAYRLNLCPEFALNLPPFLRSLYLQLRLKKKIVKHSTHYTMGAYHIQAEGGWSKRSPQDIFEFGNAYGLYSLRAYAREMLKSGKEIETEEMKKTILPILEAESRTLLHPELINELRGVIALQQPHVKQTPDSIALMKELFNRAGIPSAEQDSSTGKRLAAELTGAIEAPSGAPKGQ